jgi:hypothetical protein
MAGWKLILPEPEMVLIERVQSYSYLWTRIFYLYSGFAARIWYGHEIFSDIDTTALILLKRFIL